MTRISVRDPVYQSTVDGKWYFWDETWSDPSGPFKSEQEARRRLKWYCENILGAWEL